MPFVFLLVGIVLVVTGVRNTQGQLYDLVKSDFTGDGTFNHSFVAWIVAIAFVGGIGYFRPLRPISNAFLILVIVVLFLSNRGVFQQFNKAFNLPFKGA
jgi:hypothetical protein